MEAVGSLKAKDHHSRRVALAALSYPRESGGLLIALRKGAKMQFALLCRKRSAELANSSPPLLETSPSPHENRDACVGPGCRSDFGRRHRRSQVGFWPRSRFASGFAKSGPGPVPLYGCRAIGMARMTTRSAGHRGSIAWRGASPFMAGSPVAWLRLAAGRRLPGELRAWRRPPVADTIPEPMRVSAGRGGRCA
jgi:hypothetical protein